jgi:peptidoglycan/LPS O-acetylase OafA/YrhL
MEKSQRSIRIDLIRGLSILLVLFHHFHIAYPLGGDTARAIARNGNYGVTMFFVVSGYLITSHSLRRWRDLAAIRASAFYGLRAARILPCLFLLLVIVDILAGAGIAIFGNRAPGGAPPSLWLVNAAAISLWMNVLIIQHGWVNYALGVLWSLSVEEVFYLAFPLLCLALRRESRLLAFWVLIAGIGPWYRWMHQGEDESYLYAYFACFDAIAIGCCTALLARRVNLNHAPGKIFQVLVALAMAVLYLYAPIGQTHVFGITGMALGTAILLVGASHLQPRGQAAPPRALAALGRLSYELYLFHLIVLGTLRTLFPPQQASQSEKLLLLAAFLALSTALAALISRVYAEPLNRIVRQNLSKYWGQ